MTKEQLERVYVRLNEEVVPLHDFSVLDEQGVQHCSRCPMILVHGLVRTEDEKPEEIRRSCGYETAKRIYAEEGVPAEEVPMLQAAGEFS